MAQGLDTGPSCTQIVPLVVGDARTALRMCEAALARGVFAQAIRPPTVPEGTSRLRLAVMASHSKQELQTAARALAAAARDAGQTLAPPPQLEQRPGRHPTRVSQLFDGEAIERPARAA